MSSRRQEKTTILFPLLSAGSIPTTASRHQHSYSTRSQCTHPRRSARSPRPTTDKCSASEIEGEHPVIAQQKKMLKKRDPNILCFFRRDLGAITTSSKESRS